MWEVQEESGRRKQEVLLPKLRSHGKLLKQKDLRPGFRLQYTNHARHQLETLPYETLSRVESHLERVCREHDPLNLGHALEGIETRRQYKIEPVHVVAWVSWIEPIVRILTVVDIVFPDQPVTPPGPPLPLLPSPPQTASQGAQTTYA